MRTSRLRSVRDKQMRLVAHVAEVNVLGVDQDGCFVVVVIVELSGALCRSVVFATEEYCSRAVL